MQPGLRTIDLEWNLCKLRFLEKINITPLRPREAHSRQKSPRDSRRGRSCAQWPAPPSPSAEASQRRGQQRTPPPNLHLPSRPKASLALRSPVGNPYKPASAARSPCSHTHGGWSWGFCLWGQLCGTSQCWQSETRRRSASWAPAGTHSGSAEQSAGGGRPAAPACSSQSWNPDSLGQAGQGFVPFWNGNSCGAVSRP